MVRFLGWWWWWLGGLALEAFASARRPPDDGGANRGLIDAGVQGLGERPTNVVDDGIRATVETRERVAMSLLDLHLVGPTVPELRRPTFDGASSGELGDLLRESGAAPVPRVSGDDRQLRRSVGDEIGRASCRE